MTLATGLVTAEQLLKMGDIGRCELIYGEVVRMSPAGGKHGLVAMLIGGCLTPYVLKHDLGIVLAAETGFKIASDPDLVRAPDLAFISKARLPDEMPAGYWPGVPDLAVEVVSPEDRQRDVAEKVNMWLAHGTAVVWVADPITRKFRIHRSASPAQVLTVGQVLRDEPLLPGFQMPIADLFSRI
jgi:Uma2 family endonuclease